MAQRHNQSKSADSRHYWIVAAALASIAAALAAALAVRRQARTAERRHPPAGKFMTVAGVKLHFIDTGGSGPAVVLFHGNGAMIADMAISGLVDRLAKRRRVIVFDRPGYGYSDRPRRTVWTPSAQAHLFHKALVQLRLKRPVIFGHSWGTLVALAFAVEHPEAIRGVVLASGYYFPTPRADVALFAPPAIPIIGDVLRYTVAPFIGQLIAPKAIQKMFAPRPVTQRFAQRFPVDLALRPSQIRASSEEAAMMIPATAAIRSQYRRLRLPVIIIAGAQDKIVDMREHALRLHEEILNSELRVFPEMGHMLHHFETSEIADAIVAVDKSARRSSPVARRRRAKAARLRASKANGLAVNPT
jgi:pimeloyl-ACP methyl ester carboxylesterase